MASAGSLKDVYIEEMRDLWSANDQMQRVMQSLVAELKSCLISAARRDNQVHKSAQDDSALER